MKAISVSVKVFSAVLVLLLVGACSTTTTNDKQSTARNELAAKGIAFSELAFISAAKYGKTEIVKKFLTAGMNVNTNIDGTALIAATAAKNLDMVKLLLANGANVNETNYLGPPLSAAVYVGSYDIAKYLIDNGSDVNLASDDGTTPLVIAAQTGQGEMVELLTKNDADVNYVAPDTGISPLIIAATKKNPSAAEQLVKAGANVNYIDRSGIPVLVWALIGNNIETATMLIEHGANPNVSRVMIAALAHGDSDFVGLLVKKGVDVNGYAFGKMPLIVWCAKNNLPKSAEILIKHGADTKVADENGSTALDYALVEKEYGLVKILDPSIDISKLPKSSGDPNLKAPGQLFGEADKLPPQGASDTITSDEGLQQTAATDNDEKAMLTESADISKVVKADEATKTAPATVVPGQKQQTDFDAKHVLSPPKTFDPTAK